MRNPRRAFSREELLEQVWGFTYGDTSTVTVHIRRLREKIETDPAQPTYVTTVWGVGLSVRRMTVLAMSQSHAVQLVDGRRPSARPSPASSARSPRGCFVVAASRCRCWSSRSTPCSPWPSASGSRSAPCWSPPRTCEAVDVALVAAGAVAVLAAWLLGRRVGRTERDARGRRGASRRRRIRLRRRAPAPAGTAPLELARLAAQLKETSTRLYEAHERERTLDASRRELIAWVSHDLRTPLAGIRAIAEALEDGVVTDDDTVRRYHRTLARGSGSSRGTRRRPVRTEPRPVRRASTRARTDLARRRRLGCALRRAPIAAAKGVRLVGELGGPPPELDRVRARAPARVAQHPRERDPAHARRDGTVVVEAGSRRRPRVRVGARLRRRHPGVGSSPRLRSRVPR